MDETLALEAWWAKADATLCYLHADAMITARASAPAAPADAERLLREAVDLITGDKTGLDWKRACRRFATEARETLAALEAAAGTEQDRNRKGETGCETA